MSVIADLPIIDLSSPDSAANARSIRKACLDHGFFYIINHGVTDEQVNKLFEEGKKFFALPLEEKNKLIRKNGRGYTGFGVENSDPKSGPKGDEKENFEIGVLDEMSPKGSLNLWPSEELLPGWRSTMEDLYRSFLATGKKVMRLLALALDLNEDYFDQLGALSPADAYLSHCSYPGKLDPSGKQVLGIKAHCDYGMITLLVTDGVPGLQICRDKFRKPQVWEDVKHINGAFIVNIADMMERWTNLLFKSTLHRVVAVGKPRHSISYHIGANPDCVVECIKSCTDESTPPRFPPIRAGDYLAQKWIETYK